MKTVGLGTLLILGLLKIIFLLVTGFFLAIGFAMGYSVVDKYKKRKIIKLADKTISDEQLRNAMNHMAEEEKKHGNP